MPVEDQEGEAEREPEAEVDAELLGVRVRVLEKDVLRLGVSIGEQEGLGDREREGEKLEEYENERVTDCTLLELKVRLKDVLREEVADAEKESDGVVDGVEVGLWEAEKVGDGVGVRLGRVGVKDLVGV